MRGSTLRSRTSNHVASPFSFVAHTSTGMHSAFKASHAVEPFPPPKTPSKKWPDIIVDLRSPPPVQISENGDVENSVAMSALWKQKDVECGVKTPVGVDNSNSASDLLEDKGTEAHRPTLVIKFKQVPAASTGQQNMKTRLRHAKTWISTIKMTDECTKTNDRQMKENGVSGNQKCVGSERAADRSSGSERAAGRSSGSERAAGRSSGSERAAGRSSGSERAAGRSSGSECAAGRSSGSECAAGRSSGSEYAAARSSGSERAAAHGRARTRDGDVQLNRSVKNKTGTSTKTRSFSEITTPPKHDNIFQQMSSDFPGPLRPALASDGSQGSVHSEMDASCDLFDSDHETTPKEHVDTGHSIKDGQVVDVSEKTLCGESRDTAMPCGHSGVMDVHPRLRPTNSVRSTRAASDSFPLNIGEHSRTYTSSRQSFSPWTSESQFDELVNKPPDGAGGAVFSNDHTSGCVMPCLTSPQPVLPVEKSHSAALPRLVIQSSHASSHLSPTEMPVLIDESQPSELDPLDLFGQWRPRASSSNDGETETAAGSKHQALRGVPTTVSRGGCRVKLPSGRDRGAGGGDPARSDALPRLGRRGKLASCSDAGAEMGDRTRMGCRVKLPRRASESDRPLATEARLTVRMLLPRSPHSRSRRTGLPETLSTAVSYDSDTTVTPDTRPVSLADRKLKLSLKKQKRQQEVDGSRVQDVDSSGTTVSTMNTASYSEARSKEKLTGTKSRHSSNNDSDSAVKTKTKRKSPQKKVKADEVYTSKQTAACKALFDDSKRRRGRLRLPRKSVSDCSGRTRNMVSFSAVSPTVNYAGSRRVTDAQLVNSRGQVWVTKRYFREYDLEKVGNEMLLLQRLRDDDIAELKQQIQQEEMHRRKEKRSASTIGVDTEHVSDLFDTSTESESDLLQQLRIESEQGTSTVGQNALLQSETESVENGAAKGSAVEANMDLIAESESIAVLETESERRDTECQIETEQSTSTGHETTLQSESENGAAVGIALQTNTDLITENGSTAMLETETEMQDKQDNIEIEQSTSAGLYATLQSEVESVENGTTVGTALKSNMNLLVENGPTAVLENEVEMHDTECIFEPKLNTSTGLEVALQSEVESIENGAAVDTVVQSNVDLLAENGSTAVLESESKMQDTECRTETLQSTPTGLEMLDLALQSEIVNVENATAIETVLQSNVDLFSEDGITAALGTESEIQDNVEAVVSSDLPIRNHCEMMVESKTQHDTETPSTCETENAATEGTTALGETVSDETDIPNELSPEQSHTGEDEIKADVMTDSGQEHGSRVDPENVGMCSGEIESETEQLIDELTVNAQRDTCDHSTVSLVDYAVEEDEEDCVNMTERNESESLPTALTQEQSNHLTDVSKTAQVEAAHYLTNESETETNAASVFDAQCTEMLDINMAENDSINCSSMADMMNVFQLNVPAESTHDLTRESETDLRSAAVSDVQYTEVQDINMTEHFVDTVDTLDGVPPNLQESIAALTNSENVVAPNSKCDGSEHLINSAVEFESSQLTEDAKDMMLNPASDVYSNAMIAGHCHTSITGDFAGDSISSIAGDSSNNITTDSNANIFEHSNSDIVGDSSSNNAQDSNVLRLSGEDTMVTAGTKYQNPGRQQYQHSRKQQYQHCRRQQYQHCRRQQYQHCRRQQYQYCRRQQYQHCRRQQYQHCRRQQYQHCRRQQYQHCRRQQYQHCRRQEHQHCRRQQYQHCRRQQHQYCRRQQYKHCRNRQLQHCRRQHFQYCRRQQYQSCRGEQFQHCWRQHQHPHYWHQHGSRCQYKHCRRKQCQHYRRYQHQCYRRHQCQHHRRHQCQHHRRHLCQHHRRHLCQHHRRHLCQHHRRHLCQHHRRHQCQHHRRHQCQHHRRHQCQHYRRHQCQHHRRHQCS